MPSSGDLAAFLAADQSTFAAVLSVEFRLLIS
jgi:hypothetical protein